MRWNDSDSQMKDTGVEWIGKIPRHWETAKLKKGLSIRNGRDYKDVEVEEIEGSYPVYGSGGEFRRASDFLFEGESILFGRKGTIDKPLHVSGRFWTVDTMFYSEVNPGFHPRFMYYMALTFPYDLYQTNTALPSMTQGDLLNNPIAYPRYEEQVSIASFLDRETQRIDSLISEKKKFIHLLKEKRQALISHVVTKGLDPDVEMKDSGVEWIGEIPIHWSQKRLKHLISLIESGTSVNAANVQAEPDQIGVLKTSSVYGGSFDPNKTKTVIDEDIVRVSCPLKQGALIVSRMNTPDLVGAAGYVFDAPENIFLPDRLWQVEFNSATLPEFVYYWTLTEVYRNQVKISCEGTSSSMQNISQGDFKNYHLAVPSLEEQIRIVDHIRSRASFIEKLIAEVNHSIDLLKEHRTALISAAVTGKIDLRDKEVA